MLLVCYQLPSKTICHTFKFQQNKYLFAKGIALCSRLSETGVRQERGVPGRAPTPHQGPPSTCAHENTPSRSSSSKPDQRDAHSSQLSGKREKQLEEGSPRGQPASPTALPLTCLPHALSSGGSHGSLCEAGTQVPSSSHRQHTRASGCSKALLSAPGTSQTPSGPAAKAFQAPLSHPGLTLLFLPVHVTPHHHHHMMSSGH